MSRVLAGDSRGLAAWLEALPAVDVRDLGRLIADATRGSIEWRHVPPLKVTRLSQARDGWAVAALFSVHESGFVRETALTELLVIDDPRALPFIVLRLNDWVGPIRELALGRRGRRLLRRKYASAWVHCLPLVESLGRAQRSDHRDFIEEVLELVRLHGMEALRAAVRGDDPWLRRRCAKLWLQAQPDVVLALLAHDDPGVRLLSARAMVHLRGALLEACFEVGRRDRVVAIRREAFRAALARLPEAHARLETLLFDQSRGLRELARFYLHAATPQRDFAAEYRRSLAYSFTAPALNGLVETGDADDLARLTALRDHADARVRRMVVRAVAGKARPLSIVGLVADADTAVTKAATRGLSHRMGEDIAGALLALVPAAPHVERHVARLLGRLGRRAALLHLLRFARVAMRTDLAVDALERWLGRTDPKARPYALDDASLHAALALAKIPAELAARIARRL